MQIQDYKLSAIGTVQSCYKQKFGTPRQSQLVTESFAKIKLFNHIQPELSLQGLEGFSHCWVLFYFHKNSDARFHAKIHPPKKEGESIGLFATRSPHRPNPIGLSLVKIEEVLKDGILISGLDIIDETPVLDIKPYLPHFESIPAAKCGWVDQVAKNTIQVHWSEVAEQKVQEWQNESEFQTGISFKKLIEQTLSQDPRPLVYKGYEGKESEYKNEHAMIILDRDVHFKFLDSVKVLITEIKNI